MIRKASLLLAGAALGALVAVTLTQTQFLSGTAANAASADTYRELNLFGDVFERIRADYVETPDEEPGRITPESYGALQENIKFAKTLGAKVVCLKARNVADALLGYARHNGITHVIFGQSARTRWDIFWRGSVINRFLAEVRDATVHVIPINRRDEE